MNKIQSIVMILVAMLVISCTAQQPQETQPQEEQTPAMEEPEQQIESPEETEPAQETAPTETGLSAEIERALSDGSGVKCVSSSEGQTATVYFKSENVRMDVVPVDTHAIYFKDPSEYIYTWTQGDGFKFKPEDIMKMAEQAGQKMQSRDEVVNDARANPVECTLEEPPADAFTPPANINFQDMSEMMKAAQGYMNSIPQIPQ